MLKNDQKTAKKIRMSTAFAHRYLGVRIISATG